MERLKAAFRAGEQIYAAQGSPLYAALSKAGAEDAEVLELASHALAAAPPVHLFTAAHYLLLGGVEHELARFFPTLAGDPGPPDEAFPHLRAFCREHRAELAHLLATRPVQMTYVERCRTLLVQLCHVGALARAPLHLVELGCSAGIMLTFDRYAYSMRPGEWVGPADAAIRLTGELHGEIELSLPRIASRTGIDLNLIDPASEDDRRWMLATCFPELRAEQANLMQAMDIVAATGIDWRQGDALVHLPEVLAARPDPVCVYHSACLFYWPDEAKAALDAQLREASRERTIWRVALEPGERFDQWQTGAREADIDPALLARMTGENTISRYENGEAETRLVARSTSDFGTVWWLG